MKVDPNLSPYTKINSRCIKDLNLRHEIVKILEDNIRKTLLDTGLGKDLMTGNPKANATKTKNRQMGLNETKKLLHSKINNQQSEQATSQMEEIFANSASNRTLTSRIYKELKQLNNNNK